MAGNNANRSIFQFFWQSVIMRDMRKLLLIWLLIWCGAQMASAQETLETAIRNKDWPALAAQFGDATHQQLAVYFKDCQGVGFSVLRQDDLMFFARFRDFAEIGEITYKQENGKYTQLSLKRNIKPLHFINSFSRYAVTDRFLRMGDAEIHFIRGALYRGLPMGNVFIFSGQWEFKIRPESEEERLTLQNQVRSDTLKKESQAGVFIFNEPDLAGRPAGAHAGQGPCRR